MNTNNTKKLEESFDNFKEEVVNDFQTKLEEYKQHVKQREFDKGVKSLQETLPDIENLKITKSNADHVVNLFKCLERFEGNPSNWQSNWDATAIKTTGAGFGFDEQMSYTIYYLARFAAAHEKLTEKKDDLYKIITGVN